MLCARQALLAAERTVTSQHAFITHLSDACGAASVERIGVVQELLIRGQGGLLSFDSQAGASNIPMHQVRSARRVLSHARARAALRTGGISLGLS